MDGFWYLIHRQEVYYRKGPDYMRYDGHTMEYSSPDFSKISMKGDLGLQGE